MTDQTAKYAEILQEAIKNKKPCWVIYGDRGRAVCPHLLGETKSGLVAHVYQYQGPGLQKDYDCFETKGTDGGWRYMYLDKMSQVAILPEEYVWYPAPQLQKTEKGEMELADKPYSPPKFITRILALVGE